MPVWMKLGTVGIGLLILVSVSVGAAGEAPPGYAAGTEYICLYGYVLRVSGVRCAVPFRGTPYGNMTWMVYDCPGTEEVMAPWSRDVCLPDELVGSYTRLHVLQQLGHALDAPQGLLAGHVYVQYSDGSETTYDLIVGVNTAEWAYERPDWADCLLHRQVSPASSWTALDSEGCAFFGHDFYVAFDLEPEKAVVRIGFRLSENACSPRPRCGCGDGDMHTWFRVRINGLALQLPAEE